jgi:pimeloyl-ACP methyl ester carboxylesterase
MRGRVLEQTSPCVRRFASPSVLAAVALLAGCGTVPQVITPVGVPTPLSYIIKDKASGPIVVMFPGRSAPTDDITLGIREMCLKIAERVDGSVAMFSWKVAEAAGNWVDLEVAERRAANERVRIAFAGHSWGGETAGVFAARYAASDAVDEISALVTIDAIDKGYFKSTVEWFASFFSLEWVFGYRLGTMAYTATPTADGTKLRKHVNYYQLSSPLLHAHQIPTADANYEVWFDNGDALGHGNLDNFLEDVIAVEIERAFVSGGDR